MPASPDLQWYNTLSLQQYSMLHHQIWKESQAQRRKQAYFTMGRTEVNCPTHCDHLLCCHCLPYKILCLKYTKKWIKVWEIFSVTHPLYVGMHGAKKHGNKVKIETLKKTNLLQKDGEKEKHKKHLHFCIRMHLLRQLPLPPAKRITTCYIPTCIFTSCQECKQAWMDYEAMIWNILGLCKH